MNQFDICIERLGPTQVNFGGKNLAVTTHADTQTDGQKMKYRKAKDNVKTDQRNRGRLHNTGSTIKDQTDRQAARHTHKQADSRGIRGALEGISSSTEQQQQQNNSTTNNNSNKSSCLRNEKIA